MSLVTRHTWFDGGVTICCSASIGEEFSHVSLHLGLKVDEDFVFVHVIELVGGDGGMQPFGDCVGTAALSGLCWQ